MEDLVETGGMGETTIMPASAEAERRLFFHFVCHGKVEAAAAFLEAHPAFDINGVSDDGLRAINLAGQGDFPDMMRLLLARQDISLNDRALGSCTPLSWAAYWGDCREVQELLITDPRVDVNAHDTVSGATPLFHLIYHNNIEVTRCLLTQRDRPAIDLVRPARMLVRLNYKNKVFQNVHRLRVVTPVQYAREMGHRSLMQLLMDMKRRPVLTRECLFLGRRDPQAIAGHLFGVVVLLCDGYLAIKRLCLKGKAARLLLIAKRLPLELQMMLAARTALYRRDHVPPAQVEVSLRYLAFCTSRLHPQKFRKQRSPRKPPQSKIS